MNVRLTIAGLIFILFQGCAKLGSPSGGPQDNNPPVYIQGIPENRSTNFTGDRIDITFDEYIQLKDQAKEIVISPPTKHKPLVRVREKSIRVTFDNELLPQTTYTLNFGLSLSDLNEGNPLSDFEFVFSTGDVIDSLSVTGQVLNAFDHKPESEGGLFVMLYENLADSAPLMEIPRYYGKANKDGLFAVNNIHPDTFRIIAVKDKNNNQQYDPGIENVAFLDSLLFINAENVVPVTYIKDTVKIIIPAVNTGKGGKQNKPVVEADTVIAPGKLLNALNISLFYFLEENDKVFLTSRERSASERFSFIFSRPLYDTLEVAPLNFKPNGDWHLKEFSKHNDTLVYWITDTLISKLDTLKFELSYMTTDSLGLFMERIDTVKLRIQSSASGGDKNEGGRRTKTETTAPKKEALSLTGNIASRSTLDLNKSIIFTSARPLKFVDPDSMELYKLVDTVFVKQPFTCFKDTAALRKFRLNSKWEEDTRYTLLIKPGSAFDIYGLTNDSINLSFTTQTADYYGKILLTFSSYQYPVIVQLLNEKGRVMKAKVVTSPGLVTFDYLSPGKYSFKGILDRNGNGEWDTGNYLKHRQPEEIFLSGNPESLRSNWDWEPTWSISK